MLLLLMIAAAPQSADLMETARQVTSADHRCVYDSRSTDITVCGLRHADLYRVPFIIHDAGDPRYETVAEERTRLLHRTTPVADLGPFQVESGMAGVSTGTHGTTGATGRPLAP